MAEFFIGVAAFTATPPTANAGPDQSFNLPANTATLTGSGASTDGGSIVSYAWTEVSGPSCTITSPSSASTGVTGMTTAGTYTFQLLVTDNLSMTGTDTISIVVGAVMDATITLAMSADSTQFIVQATIDIPLAMDTVITFCGQITQGGDLYGCGGGYPFNEATLTLLAGTSSISGNFGTINHGLGTITDFGFAIGVSSVTNDGIRNVNVSFPT